MVYPVVRQTKAVCPLKRLGDGLSLRLRHDPDPSETGNNPKRPSQMKDVSDRMQDRIVDFLPDFITDLNKLADDGWALLVEGPRDARTMKNLGYRGRILTVSTVARSLPRNLGTSRGVVILTDLDREGRQLAARYTRILKHEGVQTTLRERKRLLVASNGIFRQIENLSRFAEMSTG